MADIPPAVGRSATTGRLVYPALVLLVVAAVLAFYAALLHPWLLNSGSTAAEQQMVFPGDESAPDPSHRPTRAITIDAPPAVVWSWLVQHGQDRAGFYSNHYLENLFGADIHNVDEIRPEWQQRAVGDKVPMARPDILGGAPGDSLFLRIAAIDPGRLLTTIDGNDLPARWLVVPVDGNRTRLVLREMSFAPAMGRTFTFWVWDPMHFVMEQRMLRGIKERAEGRPLVPGWLALVARAGWAALGLVVAGAFLSRRSWVPVGLLCAVLVVPSLISTGDFDSALAGFLALGISLLGLLLFGRRWVVAYPLVAAAVLLILLLAPDSYAAFGLLFGPVALGCGLYLWRQALVGYGVRGFGGMGRT